MATNINHHQPCTFGGLQDWHWHYCPRRLEDYSVWAFVDGLHFHCSCSLDLLCNWNWIWRPWAILALGDSLWKLGVSQGKARFRVGWTWSDCQCRPPQYQNAWDFAHSDVLMRQLEPFLQEENPIPTNFNASARFSKAYPTNLVLTFYGLFFLPKYTMVYFYFLELWVALNSKVSNENP